MKVKPIARSNVAMLQVAVDPDLRRKFRARCMEEGKTMSQKLEEMIRAWLKVEAITGRRKTSPL